jgi:hypothetical protein
MKKYFALVAMLCSTITFSAATYCDAPITSTQAVHTAHITCSSLGGNQYQFVFESVDAFKKYNSGSNFFMNVNGVGGFHVSKNLTQDGNTLSVIIESNVAPTIYAGDFFVQYEDGEAWFKLPIDADFSQVCEATALEQPTITTTARKVIENGHIYIIHNAVHYNTLGTQIK